MTAFLLLLIALLVIAALERNNRRQPPHQPGPLGTDDRDDRDWARIKLELLALGDRPAGSASHREGPRPA